MAYSALALCAALLAAACHAAEDHMYETGDIVKLWVSKVGPYHNPQETYEYYKLPFCHPDLGIEPKKKRLTLGEIIEGHDLTQTGYDIHYVQDVVDTKLCTMSLDEASAAQFSSAVSQHYWYQMYLDDLPIWGMVGEMSQAAQAAEAVAADGAPVTVEARDSGAAEQFVFTHRALSVAFNGPRVVEVNLTSERLAPVRAGTDLTFSYSVTWVPSTKSFENRFSRYLDNTFFEHQIHWFSIFNSFMMVIFLCGLVSLILLRTLRNDYAKYAREEDDLEALDRGVEDAGWKQVHGDVFRAPAWLMLFAALLGTGWQLLSIAAVVILYAVAGPMHGAVHEERGEVVTAVIVCWALTSAVAGYTSGSYYKQYFATPRKEAASKWQSTMMLTTALLPCTVVAVVACLNAISLSYDTTNYVPFLALFKMFCIWLFVSLPLVVGGTMFGRHLGGRTTFPCRVNSIPRPIPEGAWVTSPFAIIPLAGILPFGSIFIEMYFIFTSFWNYKFYYVYGFMALVYGILIVVTICTSIVGTYFVLNSENYHWQWVSFLAAGSTSGYVFLYSVYYFFWKTHMTGFLQIAFYFGYMGIFCFTFFIMCGTIGLMGCNMFVRKIYSNIKVD